MSNPPGRSMSAHNGSGGMGGVNAQHVPLIETLLLHNSVSHVLATLKISGICYGYDDIDRVRRAMEKRGGRPSPVGGPKRKVDSHEPIAAPVDEFAAADGSARLLDRQLETGQYFPVQRAEYLARHARKPTSQPDAGEGLRAQVQAA